MELCEFVSGEGVCDGIVDALYVGNTNMKVVRGSSEIQFTNQTHDRGMLGCLFLPDLDHREVVTVEQYPATRPKVTPGHGCCHDGVEFLPSNGDFGFVGDTLVGPPATSEPGAVEVGTKSQCS